MLQALKEFGEILLQKENLSLIDTFIENPNNGNYPKAIVLDIAQGQYQRAFIEEIEEYRRYLYKRGPSNGTDFSPTSRITDPQKSFERVLRWLDKYAPNIAQILKDAKEHILADIQERYTQKEIITLRIDGQYPYDLFQNEFQQRVLELMSRDKRPGVCALCFEHKDIFFGQIFKFFTLDKECYIAGGFDQRSGAKLFGICQDCFIKADYAKRFVSKNMEFRFESRRYLLIPKLLFSSQELIEEVYHIIDFATKKITIDHIGFASDEEDILELLQEYNNALAFYFLFLKGGSGADSERIELLIEEVVPSRITEIFKAKEQTERLFQERYTFKRLYKFIAPYNKFVYEVLEKILKGGSLSKDYLLQIFIAKIRSSNYLPTTREALMNLFFLEQLELIEGLMMDNYPRLDHPTKEGIFLLGALTQKLLAIQYAQKGSTPFMKHLKSLKMNFKDIQALLPKVINKLSEYNAYDRSKQELAKKISQALLQEPLRLSSDEINFYFAAGMALAQDIQGEENA